MPPTVLTENTQNAETSPTPTPAVTQNPDAAKIPVVSHIDDKIREMAGGSGSNRGTGGMATKITAAAAATGAGIHCCVMSGNDPANIYKLIEGQPMGTLFTPAEGSM